MGAVEFEDVYRRELHTMVALGTSLTGSREAGVDLAHEAMLRAYRSWSKVGTMDRPGAWIRRVLINLAVELADPVSTCFWAAVRALPERQRAAVALYYVEDLGVDQIAEILEVSAGTVKTSLFKARRSLERALHVEEVTS